MNNNLYTNIYNMSIVRLKSRVKNNDVFFQNRLANFTNPPVLTGDLYVEKNESVNGNLDISGNLTVGNNLRANNFYATGNYYLNNYVLIPAGTIIQSASINEPNGWFTCDGRTLDINDYSTLFNAIRYTYGGSDSNFIIPDIRGRVCVGAGSGASLTTRNLGSVGGEENHTLTIDEMPSHTHSLTRRSNPDDGAYDTDSLRQDESSAATTDRQDLGLFNTNSTGSGLSHNNMQPFIVLRYLIKY
jgi:microcystin-dependent protein